MKSNVERREFEVVGEGLYEFLKTKVDSVEGEGGKGWDYIEIVDEDADVGIRLRPIEDGKVRIVFDGPLFNMWVGEGGW